MFSDILLDSSPNRGAWMTPRARRLACLAGLAAFAVGAAAFPHLPWFQGPWSWLEGGLASAFIAAFYSLMVSFVVEDARRAGISPGYWLAAVLILNVAGLVSYLVYSARRTGDWKRTALPLAYLFEALLLGACVVLPLISTAALPTLPRVTPVPPPPAGSSARAAATGRRGMRRPLSNRALLVPNIIPPLISDIEPSPAAPQIVGAGEVGPGLPNGVPGGGFFRGFPQMPPVPPIAKPTAPKTRIVVGGTVEAAKLIFGPPPEYPALARMSRTEGTVRLKAIIGRDGTIQDLRVLSGHPLLVNEAVEAVERWRYQPTLLDGNPVEVETLIEVRFTLSDQY